MVSENTSLTDSSKAMMTSVVEEVSTSREMIDEVAAVMEEIRKGAENVSMTVASIQV